MDENNNQKVEVKEEIKKRSIGLKEIPRKLASYWKIWTFIPIILLVISAGILASNIITKGSFLERDVELTGGNMVSVPVNDSIDINAVRDALPYAKVLVTQGITKTLLVETSSDVSPDKIIEDLRNIGITSETSVRSIGPVLGEIFWQQAQLAILLAFIFITIFIFIIFRAPVPCSIVVLAAATDIIVTMGIMSVLGIKLSMAVLAALLMLIGYSIDTDVLLTARLLKSGKGSGRTNGQKIKSAMKTGITMVSTTLSVLVVIYFVSGAFVLQQIAEVLIIGILVDIPATWLANAGILRWWLERKEKRQ